MCTGLQGGMKLSFWCYLIWRILLFPERLQPITAINVLEPRAFNSESQYFIPLISWLCRQQPGGDEASNEGCNSDPTGHDFTDNFIMAGVTQPPWLHQFRLGWTQVHPNYWMYCRHWGWVIFNFFSLTYFKATHKKNLFDCPSISNPNYLPPPHQKP